MSSYNPDTAYSPSLSVILNGLPLAVILLDESLTIRFANEEARRLLGPAVASCGDAFPALWSALTQGDAAVIRAQLGAVQHTRHPIHPSRIHLRSGVGRPVPVEWTCLPAALEGAAMGLTLSLRDLSREEELQQDRDRLAAMAEESPSPVIEMDAQANVLYANPAMAAWLLKFGHGADGYPTILPRGLPALVSRCLQSAGPCREDVFLPEASAAWTFCPVAAHRIVRGYAIDMTQIHATERALRRTADELHHSNSRLDQALTEARESAQAKTAFLATVSHELRTPMNGVIGMTSLLMETALSPDQRSYTDTIRQCGEALLQLISDVLECSKIEAGKLELERLDFDLRTTVEHVLAQFAERAEVKGLELTGLVHAAVPTALCGDPGRLRQVLTNLVGNAVKFTERGDVTLQAYLEEDSADSAVIRFEITDNGIGIPVDTQARLFRPFVQADSSTTRKYGGTGLGLSISKQLIELMGGRIGVSSTPGKGSTFWCTVRFTKQPDSPRAILPSAALTGRRVLIVDDNESNRLILHALVTGWGMVDDLAEDAASAWTLIEEAAARDRPYDAVILDVMMPDKDGLQFARELQRHPACAALRIVVMTSLLRRGHAEQARQAGAMGYLPKPVRHDQLRECLRTVLGAERLASDGGRPVPSTLVTQHTLAEDTRRARVLIVEDNIVNQKLAVRMVEKLGFQPDVVENGQEALAALEAATYAAILMDCQMPVMDGFETTKLIRQREESRRSEAAGGMNGARAETSSCAHVPIIAVTANAMQGDRERCLAAGMDDYLAKPVKLEELRAVLQRWAVEQMPPPPIVAAQREALPSGHPQGVFDPEKMWRQLGGDGELLAQLIVLFLNRYEATLAGIREALVTGDALTLERSAHTLKGTAGNLCASEVVLVASRLEAVAHRGALPDAPSIYAELELEVLRLVRVLEDYREGYEPTARTAA